MRIEQAKALELDSNWIELCKEIDLICDSIQIQLTKCEADELLLLQTQYMVFQHMKRLPQDVISREEE